MVKLVIEWPLLSWKLVKAWSKICKQLVHHRLWQCLESCKSLNMWEALSVAKYSRTCVEKCRVVAPTEQALQSAHKNLIEFFWKAYTLSICYLAPIAAMITILRFQKSSAGKSNLNVSIGFPLCFYWHEQNTGR